MSAGQPDYSGSSMLALYPPPDVAGQLAVDGGLDPADMHLTVAYTGDAADVDPGALAAAARSLAARPPVQASVSGHARFTGGDSGDVIVALADSPELEALRAGALAALGAAGVDVPAEHGFTPHMTICYQDPDAPDPVGRIAPVPVTFGGISAVHGDSRTDFPFDGDDGDDGGDDGDGGGGTQDRNERAIWSALATGAR